MENHSSRLYRWHHGRVGRVVVVFTDAFKTVPLQVKGMGSLEASLAQFVVPELFDGDNKIFNEALGRKTKSHKGLRS